MMASLNKVNLSWQDHIYTEFQFDSAKRLIVIIFLIKLLAVLFVLSKVLPESLGSWFQIRILVRQPLSHCRTITFTTLFANFKQGFTDHLRAQKRGPLLKRPTWDINKGSINLNLSFEQIIIPRPAYA